jgi:hypothetical protein
MRRRLLLHAEDERFKAAPDQTLDKLSKSHSESLKDFELLAGKGADGAVNTVYERVARRLWAGRNDPFLKHDTGKDKEFVHISTRGGLRPPHTPPLY